MDVFYEGPNKNGFFNENNFKDTMNVYYQGPNKNGFFKDYF